MLRYFRGLGSGAAPIMGVCFTSQMLTAMSALPKTGHSGPVGPMSASRQKRTFVSPVVIDAVRGIARHFQAGGQLRSTA